MKFFVLTAVDAEARAIGRIEGARVAAGGIGRTNAASATTKAIMESRPAAVISAGVAGALPGSDMKPGDVVVSSACAYVEEGLVTAGGFVDMSGMGLSLGDFEGNVVPVDEGMLDALSAAFRIGVIATVATCSGTDDAAAIVARRTGALAEAMEGAAVVHAARRFGVPAIEIRAISNLTGNRAAQQWDLPRALSALAAAVSRGIPLLREAGF
jgi:futalosine hydrolase